MTTSLSTQLKNSSPLQPPDGVLQALLRHRQAPRGGARCQHGGAYLQRHPERRVWVEQASHPHGACVGPVCERHGPEVAQDLIEVAGEALPPPREGLPLKRQVSHRGTHRLQKLWSDVRGSGVIGAQQQVAVVEATEPLHPACAAGPARALILALMKNLGDSA
eukprot:CAMPEP_0173169414 /NCGR_PEP_ID=MMETSP1141-20130122/693_1 /TAXON_ID=483371 /ORGANISM="non described non described, Strain CCMP2298" /LENGTH=162 /DNA_ID=CAMNT_0014091243 /DNA_START=158 /DNA_END=647 /DNA_ORIENTATION=+